MKLERQRVNDPLPDRVDVVRDHVQSPEKERAGGGVDERPHDEQAADHDHGHVQDLVGGVVRGFVVVRHAKILPQACGRPKVGLGMCDKRVIQLPT